MQQPADGVKITYVTLPFVDGPVTVPIISLPPSALSGLRPDCTWLVPEMTGDGPDAFECGAPVRRGPEGWMCERGHAYVTGLQAANLAVGELS